MSNESVSAGKPSSASWNESSRKFLIDACSKEMRKGVNVDNGFKPQNWRAILSEFRSTSGLDYTQQQLQSQVADLKKKYNVFKALKDNSGFGWDEDLQMPTAPDSVWDAYIVAHPTARQFRRTTLIGFEDLETIFTGKIATGRYSASSTGFVSTISNASESGEKEDFINSPDGFLIARPGSSGGTSDDHPKKVKKVTKNDDVRESIRMFIDSQREATGKSDVKTAMTAFDEIKGIMGLSTTESMRFKRYLIDHAGYAELFTTLSVEEKKEFVTESLATFN